VEPRTAPDVLTAVTLFRAGRIAAVIGIAALVFHVILYRRNEWTKKACREWSQAASAIRRWPTPSVAGGSDFALRSALARPEMRWLWDARAWLADHPNQAQELVPSLAAPVFIGLTDSADVHVQGRGMPFYGHGYITENDLFTRAGRASWLLHEVTGRSDEPGVPPGTNRIILADRIKSWNAWFRALDGGRACFPAQ
jgi:hypothetical protein